jgi:hypothetical protein
MACAFAAGLAYATDSASTALDAAERADRLGAVGILAAGFIIVTVALLTLVRLQYGRMLTVIEEASKAHRDAAVMSARVAASIEQSAVVNGRVIDAIKDCEHARRR